MPNITWGYGRVSTLDQNPDSQEDALREAGVQPQHMFIEKASTRLATRPKLEELRSHLRDGDKVLVTKADRLARSTLDLLQIVASLDETGVGLEFLSGPLNRDDPYGKAMFQIQAVFAELERSLIQMRTLEGLKAARARGRKGGRKRKLASAQERLIAEMASDKSKSITEIADTFGVSRKTVYAIAKRADAEGQAA
jgi:DNA invertase Pin-like site-specific DNA recombinase